MILPQYISKSGKDLYQHDIPNRCFFIEMPCGGRSQDNSGKTKISLQLNTHLIPSEGNFSTVVVQNNIFKVNFMIHQRGNVANGLRK